MALPATGYDLATISNPSSALTDFTLVVDLSRMSSSWWADVNTSDGTRGRAAKSDGTELACDWIDFDDTAETGILRVLWSGTLAATGTQQIRIYPPNTRNDAVAADGTYGSDNAYDSYWWGYYPDGGGSDRTANGRSMTASGSPTVGGIAGKIGMATDYNGTSQYSYYSGTPSGYPLIMMCWHRPGALQSKAPVCIGGSTNIIRLYQVNAAIDCRCVSAADTIYSVISTDVWHHFAGRITSSEVEVYSNGSGSGSPASHSTLYPSNTIISIGAQNYNGVYAYYDGSISETQIHITERADEWISYEYDQTSDNTTFWGTWVWQSPSGATILPQIVHHMKQQGIM